MSTNNEELQLTNVFQVKGKQKLCTDISMPIHDVNIVN